MKAKIFLPLCLLLVLLLMFTSFSACSNATVTDENTEDSETEESNESETPSDVEPTPDPTPQPTPEPTPQPTPEPTPEPQISPYISNAHYEQLAALWPESDIDPGDFNVLYLVSVSNAYAANMHVVSFEYHTEKTMAEVQEQYGQMFAGKALDEAGSRFDIKDSVQSESEVVQAEISFFEREGHVVVYVVINYNGLLPLVEDLYDAYWPQDTPVDESLTDDKLSGRAFTYSPDSPEQAPIFEPRWRLEPIELENVMGRYMTEYQNNPGYTSSNPDNGSVLISFEFENITIDINGMVIEELGIFYMGVPCRPLE